MHSETVMAEGHLIDSDILTRVFDAVIARQAVYEVIEFHIGKTNDEPSRLKLKIQAPTALALEQTLGDLMLLGCSKLDEHDATLVPSPADCCVPGEFYSTTNYRTQVRTGGKWLPVAEQRMDGVIVVAGAGANQTATCRKLRDVKAGDQVVCGHEGIRVQPEFKERDRLGFAFMANEISSERRVETAVKKVAEIMAAVKAAGGCIVFVAGPVVVHTGGIEHMCRLIQNGYVGAILSGNALAVHDIENALYGTSLGVDLERGLPIHEGHKNHMRAINTVNTAGSIKEAVAAGIIKSGIMYELTKRDIPYVLAGSIRDDGPLPETIMDLVCAQDEYARVLSGANMVICLSSMLHSIAVGNMLPAWVPTVCVDINPAVVTKLSDRGSSHAMGVVTDVGLFVHLLALHLCGQATPVTSAH